MRMVIELDVAVLVSLASNCFTFESVIVSEKHESLVAADSSQKPPLATLICLRHSLKRSEERKSG